jgi:hypothetical protein
MLETYDKELAENRDKKLYRGKGKRATTIKTIYGEIIIRKRRYRKKPILQGVTEVVELVQKCWIVINMQHVCNRYATNISMICIGHFSVEILGNVLFCYI